MVNQSGAALITVKEERPGDNSRPDDILALVLCVIYLFDSGWSQAFSILKRLALLVKFSAKDILVLFFPRKQGLIFHANCLQWRQFA